MKNIVNIFNKKINFFLTTIIKIFFFTLIILNCNSTLVSGQEVLISDIEFKNTNFEETQLIIKLSKKANYKIYILKKPYRLVVDIENGKLENENYQPNLTFFTKNFKADFEKIFLRLEFDLTNKINIGKSFYDNKTQTINLQINSQQPNLTAFIDKITINNIDEEFSENLKSNKTIRSDNSINLNDKKSIDYEKNIDNKNTLENAENKNSNTTRKANKIPVIVIDAGHGGKDPGTIGNYLHSKEKNITLSYAKELYKKLTNEKKYIVYLTRSTDKFINLRRRVELARKKNADLFISIHVNAINDENITGFSIYTLSEQSSDKQAELLANKENQADIINGVNFSGASVDIMKTLIDLSQRNSKNHSSIFANKVIKYIREDEVEILQNTHRFAGFAVLTAPDMASVLIELGYLSNSEEEKLLNNFLYRKKVCNSIAKAIEEYFSKFKT